MQTQSLRKTIHGVLTESYMVYMICLLGGIVLDGFYRVNFTNAGMQYLGLACMVFSPLLISWAQKASRKFKHVHSLREVTPHDFMYGPYKFLQSPTHMGIFLLSLGFSLVINSVALVLATFVAYLITHLIFLPIEQKLLKKKYGATYEAYLKKVRLSI